MLQNKFQKIAIFLTGFFIGVYIMVVAAKYFLNIKALWDFSFFELLKFSVTVFIAIFIAYYLKNKHSDKQNKKRIFLEIANNISKTFEENLEKIFNFMKMNNRTNDDRNMLLLLLQTIRNKIGILEKHKAEYGNVIDSSISCVKNDYYVLKQLITGDPKFHKLDSFSLDTINSTIKIIYKILFNLDKVKLNVFV